MADAAEFTCGVCGDLFRNPYSLPCGHSFCRRPCLLPTPSSTQASCIHCFTEFHVSQLVRNYELEESVRTRRDQESRRVACFLCRSLFAHCPVCPHCHQQLCDHCFNEHVDELHAMFRMKYQSLRNEVSKLKQARETLVLRRTTLALRRKRLFKKVDSASSDLLSACGTAFSREEEQLCVVHAQIKERLVNMLDKQMLLELAVNLLRTVNDLAEYADIKKLCEVREMTTGAAATLENFTISSPEGDLPTFENYTLAENFETIFVQLSNLRLLVDERPATAAKGAARDIQGDSEPQTFSVPETAASLKPSDRTEPNFDLVNQLGTTNPEASSTTKPIQQQQQQNQQQQQLETKQKAQQLQDPKKEEKRKRKKQEREDLKKHWAIGKSQNALELYFDGVKPNITKEHLLAHFACFGQVLDVYMLMDYSGKNHRGWSYITLLPAGDPNQILKTEHAINGVKINLRRCYQFCDGKMRPMKTAGDNDNQNVNVEPLPLKGQVKAVRSKAPMPTEPVTQPQKLPEQQRDLRKHQAADKSQKSLKLFFDGLKLQITLQELKAHFAHFGEVLDVTMFMNPVTNRQNGNGYITLRPIADRRQVLDTEHFIRGSRINVRSAK